MKSSTLNLLVLLGLGGLAVWFLSRRSTTSTGSATQGNWYNPNAPANPWSGLLRNFGVNSNDRTVQTIGAVSSAVGALPGVITSIGNAFRRNPTPVPTPDPYGFYEYATGSAYDPSPSSAYDTYTEFEDYYYG